MYIHTDRDIDADPHTCACRLNCHLSAHRWGWRKFYTFFSGAKLERLLYYAISIWVLLYFIEM